MKLEGRIVDSRLSWLIIALVATLPYAGVLRAPFVFDDVKLVKENELLRVESGEAVDRFLPTFAIASREWDSDELRENYRPLRFFSYYLDYQLSRFVWGEFPADEPPTLIFHVQNLAWHLANALLVLFLGRRLLGSRRAGFILAVLFALHPLQTEAVTYVSGRRDVLSTFFFLAALALYLRSPAEKPLRWSVLATSPLAFACGFFSKEMVVTLPAVVLLVDWYRRPLWEPRRVALHALLWLVALAFAGITLANESLRAEPLVASELTSRFLMPARYALRYLFLVLFPVSQSLDYSYDAIAASRGLFDPWTTFASLLGVALLAATALWGFVRRRAAVALGISWFLVTLTPVLQFVPIAERFAERFAYLPSIGILLVVSSALATLWKARAPLGRGLVGALALTLFLATVLRNGEWTSELAIWEAATRAQPRAARSHLALGNALRAERRYAEAGEAYSVALEIWATNPEPSSLQRGQALRARMHRGGVYALLGDSDPGLLDRAIEDLRAVVTAKDTDGTPIETSSNPVHVLVQRELGACLLRKGLHYEAAARFRRIVEIGAPPQLVADAHYSLGKIHLLEKDVSAAVAAFQRSVRALPADDPRRFNVLIEISDVHSNLEDDAEAAWRVLEDAEAENPPEEVRVGILLRMAQILDRLGEIESCVDKLNQALAIDPHAAPVLVTMAEIETNLEHFDAAERYYQAVLERDRGHRQAREGLRLLEARRRMGSGAGDSEPADVMRALVSRAAKHRRKGELLAARDVYGQLLGIARQFGEEEPEVVAYCGIGETEEGLGRYGHAKRALEAAERLRPRRAETLLRLAAFHQRRTAEKKIARDHYLRYFEALEPGETPIPEAHLNLGYVHADLKEWNESFDAFQRYLESGAGDAKAREEVEAFLNDGVIPHLIDQ